MSDPTDHFGARRYLVRHETVYEYDAPREGAYERGRLMPRSTPGQTVLSSETSVEPEPEAFEVHLDGYGNPSCYFEIRTPYDRLRIVQESIVRTESSPPEFDRLNRWTVGEAAGLLAETGEPCETAEFLLPSPLVGAGEQIASYALGHLPPDAPLGDAVLALTRGIHRDFAYRSGVTTVETTQEELLRLRQGVCQDFAQLAIACLRSQGLPARYVSGYIETSPPPGGRKLTGSDASHAWAAVMLPDGSWLDLDPTNDHFADSRYIVTAWGRDFGDVSPLRGIVSGEPSPSRLRVGVDVVRLSE